MMSFKDFASTFFQDKSKDAYRHTYRVLTGPLLKQVWGDGDTDRVLGTWQSIQRFLGDQPVKSSVSNIQLVQHICNVGMTRPNTRDEIYCQVIRQITGNPDKLSTARAWILLALCCGCFPPTDGFLPVLKDVVENGPPLYKQFLQSKLERTLSSTMRKKPPTALEIDAAFRRVQIDFPVFFFSGSLNHSGDSHTKASEVVATLLDDPRLLKDNGHALCVASSNLEHMTSIQPSEHILDIIFEYESLHYERGIDWRKIVEDLPWRLVYRKETFSPWIERYGNMDALYLQILDGLERSVYECTDKDQMALILAQRYYILCGEEGFDESRLAQQLMLNPLSGMETSSTEKWVSLVTEVYDRYNYHEHHSNKEEMKTELINYAKKNWADHFSRTYVGCDVKDSRKTHENVSVLINNEGVVILQATKSVGRAGKGSSIHRIKYSQMADLSGILSDGNKKYFEIASVLNGNTVFQIFSSQVDLMHDFLENYFRGCCFRSKYVIALDNQKASSENPDLLSFQKGDLIVLPKIWAEADVGGWCRGLCQRTKKQGDFSAESVFVMASLSRPDADLISQFEEYCQSL